jgi:hypothetical protein
MYTIPKPSNWVSEPMYKKIQHYKTQLDGRFAQYVDKIEVKRLLSNIDVKCANVIRVLDSPNDLTEKDLNCNHIIKSAHGSGWNISIQPSTTVRDAKRLLQSWNKHYSHKYIESQYQYIRPRFFIEEKIDDKYSGKSGSAIVFMFRCIYGKPITIGIKMGDIQNKYHISGEPIEINFPFEMPLISIKKMELLSEKLSDRFEFVRVDFYLSTSDEIYFSEFTFTPACGGKLYSDALEAEFGRLWI